MSSGHVIHTQDWPEVSRLIQRERSGQFGKRPSETQQASSQDSRSVILLESLGPGGVTRGQVVRNSGKFVQDVFSPDEVVKRVRLGIGREGFEPEEFSQEINLDESTPEEILQSLSGTSVDQHVETVEKAGRRVKFLFKESAPGFRFVNDPDQPRLFVNQSSVRLSTEIVYLYAGPSVSNFLLPGTFCQVDHVAGKGLTVIDFERYPEPVNSETQLIFAGVPGGCSRQVVKTGGGSGCNACNPGDTPGGFMVDVGQVSPYWPVFADLLDEEIQNFQRITLIHDEGCKWESDWFADDLIKMTLEIFKTTNNPPHAQLRLIGNGSFYAEGLSISYWSDLPFDALGLNKLYKVSQESSGTATLSREDAPSCFIVRPFVESCHDSGTPDLPSSWDCVLIWKAQFLNEELSSGLRVTKDFSDNCEIGCEWPQSLNSFGNGLQVEYVRNVCEAESWTLRATISYSGSDYVYSRTVASLDLPSCLEQRLTLEGGSVSGLPDSITLKPWQA